MNTSELIVKALENEGAEVIFGIPGEENVNFLEALRLSNILYITATDERGAAFMAVGRMPGVVSSTLGPWALNIPNGLAFATLAGILLVALTWQKGCRTSNKDHEFMHVNVVDVLKPLVKYQQIIFSPKQVANAIRQGFAIAQTPNFEAVHIEVPEDVGEEIVTDDITVQKLPDIATIIPDLNGITSAAEKILLAKVPLIIVGFNSSNDENAHIIRNFAESTGIHVITTSMAQGILPANHPLSLFSFDSSHDDLVFEALQKANIVITVGYNTLEFSPRLWNSTEDKAIVHISSIRAKLNQNYNPRKVLINTREGGLLMCLGELTTAVSRNLPLIILVCHDGNHGMINWPQQKRNLPSFGFVITSAEFVNLAESFGGIGYKITDANQPKTRRNKAFSINNTVIIDSPVDYSENLKIFYRREYESRTN